MSIERQAQNLGFHIIGKLHRCSEESGHYLYFRDEANNEYVLYRGILTIIAADGKVY